MTENSSTTSSSIEHQMPDQELKRLEVLLGKWELIGRTLDSDHDNITGWTTFEWLPGGYFLKSEGGFNIKGFELQALEIIGYDPDRNIFLSKVYSSMSGDISDYWWDIEGNILKHAGLGASYTGTISDGGNTIIGGWRPDEGAPLSEGSAYDAIMTRVK